MCVESLSNHDTPEDEKLYWCSFRDWDNNFIGVVICKGRSPGGAANWAIKTGIVESERADIVLIPDGKVKEHLPYINKLLSLEECQSLFTGLRKFDEEGLIRTFKK